MAVVADEVAQRIELEVARCLTRHPASNYFALIDGALVRDALSQSRARARCVSLVPSNIAATPEDLWALPFLIVLPPASSVARLRAMVRLTMPWALTADAASWFVSSLEPDALVGLLSQRLSVELPDALRATLRFADTRVLPVLHRVLNPLQRRSFFSFAQQWWYLNREHALQALLGPDAIDAASEVTQCSLALDERQQAAMIEAAEPDTIASLLDVHAPGFAALDRSRRFAFVSRNLQAAKQWGVTGPLDMALYCMAALELGELFAELPSWRIAMEEVKASRLTMREAMEQAA